MNTLNLIHLQTEDRTRHARGPVRTIRYIYCLNWFFSAASPPELTSRRLLNSNNKNDASTSLAVHDHSKWVARHNAEKRDNARDMTPSRRHRTWARAWTLQQFLDSKLRGSVYLRWRANELIRLMARIRTELFRRKMQNQNLVKQAMKTLQGMAEQTFSMYIISNVWHWYCSYVTDTIQVRRITNSIDWMIV